MQRLHTNRLGPSGAIYLDYTFDTTGSLAVEAHLSKAAAVPGR